MKKGTRFVGLDVHADTIAVAVAEAGRDGEVRSLGLIPNTEVGVRRLLKALGGARGLQACYEAGPTGYALYWRLVRLGVECEVIAPSLIPVKPGDRVKTDRRDAVKLARSHRAGELTAVWVPDPAHEALRDLVRAREAAKKDQLRARHRLAKFILRTGRRPPPLKTAWGLAHVEWLRAQTFEHFAQQATMDDYLREVEHAAERITRLDTAIDDAVNKASPTTRAIIDALQALRGIAKLTATTVAVEVGNFSRFDRASKLMAWAGATPSEHSTGGPGRERRGAITKTGNAHLRRVLFESAWAYRRRPGGSDPARKRRRALELPPEINELAAKAQHRLCRRYAMLVGRGKPPSKAAAAVGRELLGFVWAIATRIEANNQTALPAAA
jgi:transposase